MTQTGLIEKWKNDELLKVSKKGKSINDSIRNKKIIITLEHLQFAFFILFSGYLLGAIILTLEKIIYLKNNSNKN